MVTRKIARVNSLAHKVSRPGAWEGVGSRKIQLYLTQKLKKHFYFGSAVLNDWTVKYHSHRTAAQIICQKVSVYEKFLMTPGLEFKSNIM
jgi:hypothetical protein